jgi:hypothetical protein
VWLVDLLITMHSDDSWAVNEIGEIRMANLYYFSWGAIIVAGMQMMSYARLLFGHENKNEMFVVWAALVKVCMVILGASLHVWHGISDSCRGGLEDELEQGGSSFCARTKLAIGIAGTGILCGWAVTISRILGCPIPERFRTHIEMGISVILIIVFGVGLAFITGIGGPGQSVGDLFYSSWIAFVVSLGVFIACVEQLQQQEMADQVGQFEDEARKSGGYITFQDDNYELTK